MYSPERFARPSWHRFYLSFDPFLHGLRSGFERLEIECGTLEKDRRNEIDRFTWIGGFDIALLKHVDQFRVFLVQIGFALFFTTDRRTDPFAHLLIRGNSRCFSDRLDGRIHRSTICSDDSEKNALEGRRRWRTISDFCCFLNQAYGRRRRHRPLALRRRCRRNSDWWESRSLFRQN